MQPANFQVQYIEDIVDNEGISIYSGDPIISPGAYHAILRGSVQENQGHQNRVRVYLDQLWKTAGRARVEEFNRAMRILERDHMIIQVMLNQDSTYALPDYKQLKKLIDSLKNK